MSTNTSEAVKTTRKTARKTSKKAKCLNIMQSDTLTHRQFTMFEYICCDAFLWYALIESGIERFIFATRSIYYIILSGNTRHFFCADKLIILMSCYQLLSLINFYFHMNRMRKKIDALASFAILLWLLCPEIEEALIWDFCLVTKPTCQIQKKEFFETILKINQRN